MDRLSKDELYLICEKLDLFSIFNLLKCSKKIYEKREDIFLYKLNREFPNHRICMFDKKSNIKLYVKLYELAKYFKTIKNIDICEVYNLHLVAKVADQEFMNTIGAILALLEKIRNFEMRTHCIYLSFHWISKNISFLHQHEKFKLIVQQKLKQLRNEPLAEQIILDFGYIQFI